MKTQWKKRAVGAVAAALLALAMAPMVALGIGAQTADSTLTVSGLDYKDKVSFYQIIEQDSQENGAGWKFVDALDADKDGTIDGTEITLEMLRAGANEPGHDNFEVITAEMANQIAAVVSEKVTPPISLTDQEAASDGKVVVQLREGLGDEDLTPVGLYMAIVTDPAETDIVYKPIFLSADYDKDGIDGTIPAYGTYPEHENTNAIEIVENPDGNNPGTDYYGNAGVFKKSKLTLEKAAGDESDRLMDAAVGQVIPFTVTTNLPSYTQNFTSPVFKITDSLTAGLELCAEDGSAAVADSITVEVAGVDNLSNTNDYTTTLNGTTGFTVEFKNDDPSKTGAKDGILYTVKGNPQVTITYYAKVTDANAAAQVNQMDNTVRLDFTNAPDDETGAGTLKDRTRHYTFGIDANVLGGGEGPDHNTVTSEIRKIAVDANGEPIYETTTKDLPSDIEEETPDVYEWLQGATFQLLQTHAWQDADDSDYGDAGDFVDITDAVINFDEQTHVAGGTKPPVSDATGHIAMKGLDAGIYELTEVTAPLGFSYDPSMKYVITITPSFADDAEADPTFTDVPNKILSGYTVKVDVVQGTETKASAETTYTSETAGDPATPVSFINEASEDDPDVSNPTGVITTTDTTSETALIMNKQLGILPATGGSGILFYVFIGAGIMALAVFLSRRFRRESSDATVD